MSTNFFHTFLLLLFIACCACQCVYAEESALTGGSKSVELFNTTTQITDIIKPKNGKSDSDRENITPKGFYFPFIVAADDVMVALTGVNRTDNDNDNKHIDILTKYITTEGEDDLPAKIINNADWKAQFAYQETMEKENENFVKSLAAAAKEKKMYILLLNKTENGKSDPNCGIKLVEGTVSGKTKGDINIEWETKNISSSFTDGELKKCLTEMQPNMDLSASSVYLATEKKIVFVLHGRSSDDSKKIYAFISLDDTTKDSVKLLYEGNIESKCYFDFFSWEDKIMMIPTLCEENSEKTKIVKKSNNMGKMLTDSVEPFDRLLGFMQEKSGFTTTKINNISVVLFTQQKSRTTGVNDQKKSDLWFSDGNRVSAAGRIATDDNVAFSNLLYTNGGLFALHDIIKNETPETITLSYLEEQLQNITTVIDSWKKSDAIVKNLFTDTSSDTGNFIDGLVGFLSNRSADNKKEWIDEYYYVNATVTGGNKATNGFKFDGTKNGAKWSVGKSKEDQLYNFTHPGFTLVANVTIDGVVTSAKGSSVLGVVYKESESVQKNIGLRCTKEGAWEITVGNGGSQKILSAKDKCQQGSTYLVSLILNNSKFFVYINGVQLDGKESVITPEKLANIAHFYFGADESLKEVESHVTVTNVLLYNRPFAESEVKVLKTPKKDNIAQTPGSDTKIQNSSGDVINTQTENKETTSGSTDDNKEISDQSKNTTEKHNNIKNNTNNNNNNTGNKPLLLTPESSIVRGDVVGGLLFLLLLNAWM